MMNENEKILYEARKKANEEALSKEKERIRALNTDNAIYFNFSYTALKLLGKNLYNNPLSAVAELVANGIDAKAKNIYVYINMVDKAHSVIEIVDDGTGMSYEDLAEKYVWIGRNKREDEDVAIEDKIAMMGRKGIGKLAALYLSNRYYIFSKKDGAESKWSLNVSAYKDSDFPKLDRLSIDKRIASQPIWSQNKSGTAIVLENVDLRRTGSKRIEGLKRNLSDYYLIDAIETKIWVAVVSKLGQAITYEPVKKAVAYKNFYAIFDNSSYKISEKLRDSISFTWMSQFKHIGEKERETIVLPTSRFITKGSSDFQREDGSKIKKSYQLDGWIGIHATIESKDAVDENFIRNDTYHPNKLRVYVRNKLAVNNYFDLRKSTQAMANYIEGEISFDILDDDDLPDIATSSRQDFLDDERVECLIKIVDPIVNTLFKLRNKLGQQIRQENNDYIEYLNEIERRKKEEAERLAKEADAARIEAEQAKAKAEENVKKLQAQNNTIFNAITEEQESFSAKTHLVKTNAIAIRNSVSTLAQKVGFDSYKEIGAIAISSDKILSSLKYSALAKFNIEDEYITVDLFEFCREYLETVLKKQYFEITFDVSIEGEYCVRFNPQYLSLILDNFISNSEKSNATKFFVKMTSKGSSAIITIEDNGEGFGNIDLTSIFDFGFSNTGGTGIGLYNIKRAVEKMRGTIFACENEQGGATFTIEF